MPPPSSVLARGALTAFWNARLDRLCADPEARAGITRFHRSQWGSPPASSPEAAFAETFETLIEEAELAMTLLHPGDDSRLGPVLEVGGGVGLLHGYLRASGIDAYALEPSSFGFEGSWETGVAVLRAAEVDATRWHRLYATEAAKIDRTFGLIFSFNLLEHVVDVDATLVALAAVLAPTGRMVHHTVNYSVPYEPHFRIPLVPLIPRLTELLRPKLTTSAVWRGLNFVTVGSLRRSCEAAGLTVEFDVGMFARALERLETDPLFRSRHGAFLPIGRALNRLGLGRALDRLPAHLATPLRFSARLAHPASRHVEGRN